MIKKIFNKLINKLINNNTKSINMKIKWKKLVDKDIKLPKPKMVGDVGYDLVCCERTVIPPLSRGLVPTGLAVEVPDGYWTSIDPRSSSSKNVGVNIIRGIIDSAYRGALFINVQNNRDYEFVVEEGVALAQLIIHKAYIFDSEWVDELSETERGENGFGSTGRTV